MNWQFTQHDTLREMTTAYEIRLLKGTWFHPIKLAPCPPTFDQKRIAPAEELALLKSGLTRIKMVSCNSKHFDTDKIERAIAKSLIAS